MSKSRTPHSICLAEVQDPRPADEVNLKDDMLVGAEAMSDFIGISRRQVYAWVLSGNLPTFRVGNLICARRSTLLKWISTQEGQSPGERTRGRPRRQRRWI